MYTAVIVTGLESVGCLRVAPDSQRRPDDVTYLRPKKYLGPAGHRRIPHTQCQLCTRQLSSQCSMWKHYSMFSGRLCSHIGYSSTSSTIIHLTAFKCMYCVCNEFSGKLFPSQLLSDRAQINMYCCTLLLQGPRGISKKCHVNHIRVITMFVVRWLNLSV